MEQTIGQMRAEWLYEMGVTEDSICRDSDTKAEFFYKEVEGQVTQVWLPMIIQEGFVPDLSAA